ncbi:hypothetical protein QQS45_11980 [Alteriqipengyuania flavescens]|uniref:hypothetical protein n=1 Tax=Alteriqipengyuania flavescens TaxID=3053610 RepID=UPI0025B2D408|nr:hypothetical protein [Alteriqipengyuania flavescens]WJY18327.1 hypothetical protein QQW98_11975 [Alteriqipengyuania flavescens]WJY24268.1 hypothetical protein QQS45_11980 [Alteriqipengyuania flavescens]
MINRKRAQNVLKREAYGYYCALLEAGEMDPLREYVKKRDGTRWDVKGGDDEGAQWVCRLFAQADESDDARKRRSRFSMEMELAKANDIHPDLYLGFLHEAGPGQLIEAKLKKKNKVYRWADPYRRPDSPLLKG